MDLHSFRQHGHEFIDWIADYLANMEQYPVKPDVRPGDIIKRLPSSPPENGEQMQHIFQDFKEIILPGMTHWQHPGWLAYFPANNSPASVLAEVLTAGLGAQCMSWQTSPAATELEERVLDWLREMVGLPKHFVGVIQDTASTATLAALISAREKATGLQSNKKGIEKTMRVYASTEAHSSIEKAVKIAGLGSENLRLISTDGSFAMQHELLHKAIEQDIAAGFVPICVVAALGSTSSMAMDPVDKIASICQKYKLWLHVDAAFAGTAAIVPELRAFMNGTEHADSLVFNPHKWMLTNFDCSAYYVSDPAMLVQAFEMKPEYLKTADDKQVKNYRDWGIQLGRRFRALKLWFVIRNYGVEGIRAMVREHVRLAALFAEWLNQDNCFEIMAPVQLSLVCFRLNPGGLDHESLNQLNRRFLENINSNQSIFLTHTTLNGSYTVRMAIGSRTTTEKHLRGAWEIIRKEAGKML